MSPLVASLILWKHTNVWRANRCSIWTHIAQSGGESPPSNGTPWTLNSTHLALHPRRAVHGDTLDGGWPCLGPCQPGEVQGLRGQPQCLAPLEQDPQGVLDLQLRNPQLYGPHAWFCARSAVPELHKALTGKVLHESALPKIAKMTWHHRCDERHRSVKVRTIWQ